jgi:hypothetical protein
LGYRKRGNQEYRQRRLNSRKVAEVWVRTAQSISEGKGIPSKTPFYKNVYGEPLVKPKPIKNLKMDPVTSLVTAGFYLFGPEWPKAYEEIEVPDKRGKMRRLPNNMGKGFEKMQDAFGEE